MQVRGLCTGLTLALSSLLLATEEAPWIDRVLQPIGSLSVGYQHFDSIRGGDRRFSYPGRDAFLEGSFFLALDPTYNIELETRVTRSHAHSWAIDQFKETFRYILLNDSVGDIYAFASGLSLIEPLAIGLKDPSFIHHALLELEGHLSIGKEWIEGSRWEYRAFALVAFGVGSGGSPWVRVKGALRKNFCDCHFLGFEISGEGGFGHQDFRRCKFRGYGPIAYRIGEVLFAYSHQGETGWLVTFEASYRFFSRNAPSDVAAIQGEIAYPF